MVFDLDVSKSLRTNIGSRTWKKLKWHMECGKLSLMSNGWR